MPNCEGETTMNYCLRLAALKLRSMRRGIWHRALTQLERAQVDLTVRMVKIVRSPLLAKVLDKIVDKLTSALQSTVLRLIISVGYPEALKLGRVAQSWGHNSAHVWAQDSKFARFLAIMYVNSSTIQNWSAGLPQV